MYFNAFGTYIVVADTSLFQQNDSLTWQLLEKLNSQKRLIFVWLGSHTYLEKLDAFSTVLIAYGSNQTAQTSGSKYRVGSHAS